MRQIKFRGKRVDNGWVYGDLTHDRDGDLSIGKWYVDPATVGQFTGLRDKSGREIYEGDVLETRDGLQVVRFGKHELDCCGCCYGGHQSIGFYMTWNKQGASAEEDEWKSENLTVIGNIHDNPELLETE